MKERSFKEWLNFFATVNLLIFTVLMMLIPIYPWWAFAILTVFSAYVVPHYVRKGGSKNSNRSRY